MKIVPMRAVKWLLAITMTNLLYAQIAHSAPGEDTIQLNGPVKYVAMPGAPRQQSAGMDGPTDIPAWMRARINRYVAKAFSATARWIHLHRQRCGDDGPDRRLAKNLRSGSRIQHRSRWRQLGSRYGPQAQDQVVVLRGDLVNVCR
ncbi:hypothetical protein Y695_01925 [Hydrogenophaga sp. T4]|nr:hypothetical protein Y695_01925 [Hydrogenophaga sp. T4]